MGEGFDREGSEKPHTQQPDLLAMAVEPVDGFVGRLGTGAHEDDDAFGLRVAVIVEQAVLAARELRESIHRLLNMPRAGVVERVTGLASLKERVRVLRRATDHGPIRGQGPGSVGFDELLVHHGDEVFIG